MNAYAIPHRRDWIASLVVFIIAIPLSLGIALASGAPASAGLLTAAIGGIVVGLLSGAPLVVTGPAAGLTALVFQLVQQHGLEGLAIITALAGLFQVVFAALRTGKLFLYVPKPVLEGMLAAIGFIILLGQLHVLVGASIPKSAVRALGSMGDSARNIFTPIAFCGLLAIAIQLIWPKIFRKLSWLPGALPAVAIVTLVSLNWQMPRVELAPILPGVGDQLAHLATFSWAGEFWTYVVAGLGVAFVASAESLLTARAVDTLCTDSSRTPPANLNRELFAQGTGNLLSGIVGALPMTGVIVRSAANLNAGAVSRWSAILHGVWIVAFVSLLPSVLTAIPLTALASVLILTGIKLLNVRKLIDTFSQNAVDGALWVTTSVAIVVTDLLSGLAIGLGAAFCVYLVRRVTTARETRERLADQNADDCVSQ